jgi:hypothetical protein
MMSQKIHFKRELKQEVAPQLHLYEYELIDLPKWASVRSFFFRKHFLEDIYTFIEFHLMEWVPAPQGIEPMSREFRVELWRNRGEKPRRGHGEGDQYYQNWINLLLSELLWHVLGVKIFPVPHYVWEFNTSDELSIQLHDAVKNVIEYGIPWLEDPKSKNPYPSWP